MDWAEEERLRLTRECGCIHSSEPIADALRKAREKALAEAALVASTKHDELLENTKHMDVETRTLFAAAASFVRIVEIGIRSIARPTQEPHP